VAAVLLVSGICTVRTSTQSASDVPPSYGFMDLREVPGYPFIGNNGGAAINNRGEIVGAYTLVPPSQMPGEISSAAPIHGFKWANGYVTEVVPDLTHLVSQLPAGHYCRQTGASCSILHVIPRSINDDGTIVGMVSIQGDLQGFRLSSNGTTYLVTAPHTSVVHPWGIANAIVGDYQETCTPVLDPTTGLWSTCPAPVGFRDAVPLRYPETPLTVPENVPTFARAVNGDGDVVGFYGPSEYITAPDDRKHGFLFGQNRFGDDVYSTFDVPSARWTMPRGINIHRDVVGIWADDGTYGGVERSFVWPNVTGSGTPYVIGDGTNEANFFSLGINDAGAVIGVGYNSGELDDGHFRIATPCSVNHPPTARPGGPYTIDVNDAFSMFLLNDPYGDRVQLDGTASTDPDAGCGDTLTYEWSAQSAADFSIHPLATGPRALLTMQDVHAVLPAGHYTLSLTVTDSGRASNTATTTLDVYESMPFADFTVSANPAACGQTLTFDGSFSFETPGSNYITSYTWDLGGIASATSTIVTDTFLTNRFGSYDVRLTVRDTNSSYSTKTLRVDVNQGNHAPIANAGGPYQTDLHTRVSFDGRGSRDPDTSSCGDSIVSYQWTLDGQLVAVGAAPPDFTPEQVDSFGAGVHIVTLTVTDTLGLTNAQSTTLTINGGRISLSIPNSASALTQATAQWACGSFSDTIPIPGAWSGIVNYGDGSGNQSLALAVPPSGPCAAPSATGVFSFSHSYALPGQYTMTVRVDDTVSHTTQTGSVLVTITNPGQIVLTLPSSTTAMVNSAPWGCGAFTDSNPSGGSWSAIVNYGDGSGDQPLALVVPPSGACAPQSGTLPTGVFSFNHIYVSPGSLAVMVRVTNTITGVSATSNFPITVVNTGQVFLSLPGSLSTQTNVSQWGCGSFFDTNAANGSWSGTVNYGDGSGDQPLFLSVPPFGPCAPQPGGGATGEFSFDHQYGSPGLRTVTVVVRNTVSGTSQSGSFSITVNSPAPITINVPTSSQTIVNNASSWGCGSFVDSSVSGGSWSATVNYGDGSGDQPLSLVMPGSGPCASGGLVTGTFSFSHSYGTTGQRTVSVRVTNTTTGDSQQATFTVDVVNAVNTSQIFLNLPGSTSAQTNTMPWGCGSFLDTDAGGTWAGSVNYGDGSGDQALPLVVPPSGPCAPSSGSSPTGVFSFNHAYSSAGLRTVTITVRNTLSGSSQTGSFSVNVTNGGQILLNLPGSASTLVNNASWGCGSFLDTNASGGSWSATVNYGNGSGNQPLSLAMPPSGPCAPTSGGAATGTFAFSHAYGSSGPRTVTVVVTNTVTNISNTARFTINVMNNTQIFLGLPNSAFTQVNNASWGCGSFLDGGGSGPWSATVNYGDGSGNQPLSLIIPPSGPCAQGGGSTPTGVFAFTHAYTAQSQFTVSVRVQNDFTLAFKSGSFTIDVTGGGGGSGPALVSIDVAPLNRTVLAGGTVQYSATGHFADGSSQTTDPATPPGHGPAWRSTNTAVATVSQSGLVTAIAAGQTTIVADAGGVSCETTNTCGTLTVDPLNTPVGDNVRVVLVGAPVTVLFEHVTAAGETSVESSSTAPQTPVGFQLSGTYYDVTTTAAFSGRIIVCVGYSGVTFPDPAYIRLLHYENAAWADVTTGVDADDQFVCGTTTSLSPFVVASAIDSTAPAIGAVAAVSAEATSASGSTVAFELPTASDDLDPAPQVVAMPPSGSTFVLGVTVVTVTATDRSGNTSSRTFDVIVTDTTPPALTVSGNLTAEATGPSGAAVSFAATAVDTVDGPLAVQCAPSSGSTFPLGTTTVTCSATDAHANVASAGSLVTVADTTKPIVTYVGNAGSYAVDQTVDIRCTPTDSGSGVASTTCADISGPAYSFTLGVNNYSATATDRDGNIGDGSTRFTVVVTNTSLQSLVNHFCTNAGVAAGLNAKLVAVGSAANASARAGQLGAFKNQVSAQTGKTLTANQATVLLRLAETFK
jgi:hypothetical protein